MRLEDFLPWVLSGGFALTAVWVAMVRRDKPTWKAGLVLLFACAALLLAHAAQRSVAGLADKIAWYKLFHVVFPLIPTSFLWLALHYSGARRLLTRRTLALLAVFPLIHAAIVVTNESHGWMWQRQHTAAVVGSMRFLSTDTAGPWYWIILCYCHGLMIASGCLFGRLLLVSRGIYGWQSTAVVLAALTASIGTVLDVFDLSPLEPFVTTQMGLAAGIITAALSLSTLRRTDLLSFSREAVFNNISDAIMVVDVNGRVAEANTTAARILQLPKSRVIGSRVEEMLPELPSFSARPTDSAAEILVSRESRSRVYDLHVSTLGDTRGVVRGRVIAMRDITERRKAEDRLRSLNEELESRVYERTKTLEVANHELEAFTYSVSHDLRAPLRLIDGYSRMLAEDYGTALDSKGLELCDVVQREARRMGKLIDALLALSRSSRAVTDIALLDMTALASETFDALTSTEQREGIEFSVGTLPPARGDPVLIRLVWTNLLSNALKFSSQRDPPVIKVTSTISESEITYAVTDNGTGFNMEHAGKLFGVFQRMHTDPRFPGTGVGLAIVQRVVERHGGRVWAETQPGNGATFRFTMPGVS